VNFRQCKAYRYDRFLILDHLLLNGWNKYWRLLSFDSILNSRTLEGRGYSY
jgi:hypothetical protein